MTAILSYVQCNHSEIFKAVILEILVKFLWYLNYIRFPKSNFVQNMKKNINHKNVESCWLEEYEYIVISERVFWKLALLKIQNILLKMSLVEYLQWPKHLLKIKVFWFESNYIIENEYIKDVSGTLLAAPSNKEAKWVLS